MLQIGNMDNGKPEWNVNETHIIIPMIEGDVTSKEPDKILASALNLNSLEAGDQTILTNALEHSLVIGLDKNIFETPNYKSDLVIIQNSDLKLLSSNADLKNSVAYTLSYVDQDKSEILWQAPVPKGGICSNDKAILEVRDVLNYDDSVHELGKNEQHISLDSIDIVSQVTKTGGEILMEGTVNKQKKESQFINYYSSQNGEAKALLPHLDASKFIENAHVVGNKKIFEEDNHPNADIVNSTYKLGRDTEKNILNITQPVLGTNDSTPVTLVEYMKHKTDKKTSTNRNKDAKDEKADVMLKVKGVSNVLPEKSLPLKKKAKMKRTVTSSSLENRTSLLKQDALLIGANQVKIPAERKVKKPLIITSIQEENQCNRNSEEPSINKGTKRKKVNRLSKKLQKTNADEEGENELKKLVNNSLEEDTTIKINYCTFDRNKFNDIYDLVECLRKCRIINASVWQTLNSGLKEMKVDILKEMNAKINERYSPEKTQYSPQLKAFALVLYFKQPAAFNRLSQVYKTGWPSLNVIKEWKRQMNSQQRPNLRAETETENST